MNKLDHIRLRQIENEKQSNYRFAVLEEKLKKSKDSFKLNESREAIIKLLSMVEGSSNRQDELNEAYARLKDEIERKCPHEVVISKDGSDYTCLACTEYFISENYLPENCMIIEDLNERYSSCESEKIRNALHEMLEFIIQNSKENQIDLEKAIKMLLPQTDVYEKIKILKKVK